MHLGMVENLVPFTGHLDLKPSLIEKSCPENISYIIKGRNPKFDGWMQLWMAECHIPFLGHLDLDL